MRTKSSQRSAKRPLISDAGLNKLVSDLSKAPITVKTPVMELSARRPYDATHGLVDMYKPGRWDTSSDQIFMDPIVQLNPNSPGEWTGSAGYITFTPPSSGTYVMIVNFSGYQIAMRLNGPTGSNTVFSNSNTPNAVGVLFTGTGGSATGFSFSCTGIYLGFVQSIKAFLL